MSDEASFSFSSLASSLYDAIMVLFADEETQEEELQCARYRLAHLSVEYEMPIRVPTSVLEVERAAKDRMLLAVVRADEWNASAGDFGLTFFEASAFLCQIHRTIFTPERIRAHRDAHLDARGNKIGGYDSLIVDPEYRVIAINPLFYKKRLRERLIDGTAKLTPVLNKTRDEFSDTKLVYDPVALRLVLNSARANLRG